MRVLCSAFLVFWLSQGAAMTHPSVEQHPGEHEDSFSPGSAEFALGNGQFGDSGRISTPEDHHSADDEDNEVEGRLVIIDEGSEVEGAAIGGRGPEDDPDEPKLPAGTAESNNNNNTVVEEERPVTLIRGPSNATAYLGDRVEMHCQTEGYPKPKVSWHSARDGELPSLGQNFRIHRNGSLIFRSVGKQDESGYRCVAQNPLNSVETDFARLTVEAEVKIVVYPEVIKELAGTPKDLHCTATGDPPPLISWLKDGSPLPLRSWTSEVVEGQEYKPFAYFSRSVLRVNVTDTANYTCYAINQMVGGRQSSDQRSFMVYVVETSEGKDDEVAGSGSGGDDQGQGRSAVSRGDKAATSSSSSQPKGYCAPYNGQVCKKYLKGRGLVWFNVSQDNSGGWLNEQVTQAIWDELVSGLGEPCRSAAESLLCKYAFPDCVLKDGVAVGLPLCRQDCLALRDHYCYKDWALLEDNKRRGVTVRYRGHFRLPDCAKLPVFDNSTVNKFCTQSSVTAMRWDLATTNCIKGTGRFYRGKMNMTSSGLGCQTWFTDLPHTQSTPPKGVFPEMGNSDHNYCRNPGGTETHPWCYTLDPVVRWQHCDIPRCENMTELIDYAVEVEVFGNAEDFLQGLLSPTFIILSSCVASATLVVFLLLALICNKLCNRKSRHSGGYTQANVQEATSIDLDKLPQNEAYHLTGAQLNPKLEVLEYPRNDIIYLRDIGQGAFGRVFQAKAPNLMPSEEFSMVAVKMLKDDATENLRKDFEREACILSEFEHPHIVKLLGVCTVGKPMCLLFEFMSRGDLSSYLRACSPHSFMVNNLTTNNGSSADKDSLARTTTASSGGHSADTLNDTKISHVEQVNIAKQVCSGMVYLSDRNFVHRDLASRNCLMDAFGNVKIADFGLSQRVYSAHGGNAYYRGDEEDAIPIRWMPPEAILQNRYTVESDVWAFGVLLWEIFSLALQPYYGLSHEEVVKYVKSGKVLNCPDNTPKSMYKVMGACWALQPAQRPTFRVMHRELETISRELLLIQKHFRSQKSILSVDVGGPGGRLTTPHSPAKSHA